MLKVIHTYPGDADKGTVTLYDVMGAGFLRRGVKENEIAKLEIEQAGPFFILHDATKEAFAKKGIKVA